MKNENLNFGGNKMSKKKPVEQVRLGTIVASIWKNNGDKGRWYNVTLQRAYRAEDGWEYADTFGRDDLLQAAKVLDITNSKIFELQAEDRAQDG